MNTIVDIWKLKDYGPFERAYAIFRENREYPEIRTLLDQYAESETLVFMDHQYGTISGDID